MPMQALKQFRSFVSFALSMILSTAAFAQTPPASQGPYTKQGAEVGAPVVPGEFSGDLRNLPPPAPYSGPPIDVNPRPQVSKPPVSFPPPVPKPDPLLLSPGSSQQSPDPLQQSPSVLQQSPDSTSATASGRSFATPRKNFAGQGDNGDTSNPDTVGDVGPNHYIQMVNRAGSGAVFQIFDKSGNTLVGSTRLGSLAPLDSRCAAPGSGDPIVLYDPLANRWLMSEIAGRIDGQPDFLCVYISKTSNPVSGGWWTYAFETPSFPDYPHYAVWPDAYYVGVNEAPNGTPAAAAYALDRKKMLLGKPATSLRFQTDQLPAFAGFNELTPADLDGKTPPPAGAPGYFVRHVDDELHFNANTPKDYLEIWAFRADFANPANATFTRLPNVPVADFDSNICADNFRCIHQPNTDQRLDALREMTLHRVVYRNFFGLETLVGNFTVHAIDPDQAGIRWFVLNKIDRLNWVATQQGTYAPDAASRWMGSIAMDKCGNLALGYSVSSDTVYPSIRYTGRLLFDPLGTMPRGENSMVEGGNSYTRFNRWGDYTSMNVDPGNDSTFWYTNQYIDPDGNWQTQIASFNFPSCR